jgi:putative addiction module killer protein
VYFTRRGKTLILLLVGGDKSSQRKDIKRAREMAKSLKE